MLKLLRDVMAFRRKPIRNMLPGFDPVFYLYWNPDVRFAKLDPLGHFGTIGWREGRDPSMGFSTRGYLAANPDVAAAGTNPLIHFLEFGLAEGRTGWQRTAPPRLPISPPPPDMKLLPPPRAFRGTAT